MDNRQQQYGPLFNPQGDLTPSVLWAYAHGLLAPVEVKAVEEHLAQCEFCKEALEGAAFFDDMDTYISSVAYLNEQVDKRVGERKRVIGLVTYRQWAAAAILVLVAGATFLWFNKSMTHVTTVADNKAPAPMLEKEVPTLSNANTDTTDSKKEEKQPASTNQVIVNSSSGGSYGYHTQTLSNAKEDATTNDEKAGVVADDYKPQGASNGFVSSGAAAPAAAPVATGSVQADQQNKLETQKRHDEMDLEKDKATGSQMDVATVSPKKSKKNIKSTQQVMADSVVVAGAATLAATENYSQDAPQSTSAWEEVPSDHDINSRYTGGQNALQQYIDSSATHSPKQIIKVVVTVSGFGKVTEVKFVGLPQLTNDEQTQLIKIIKAAPGWLPLKGQEGKKMDCNGSVKF